MSNIFTGQKDIKNREIREGDIVDFNPIGSNEVLRGKVAKNYCSEFYISVEGEKSNKWYGFNEIFGHAKIIERKT